MPTGQRRGPEPLRPPWWAHGGHAQTVWSHLLPSRAPSLERHERIGIEAGDGDVLVAFHARPERAPRAIWVLFHGLAGSTESDDMRRTAALALRRGAAVLAVNHRGAGAGRGRARRPYHSGVTGDLARAIERARALHPGTPVLAVGLSLSGNTLLLLLARDDAHPDAAIAVNPPVDLAQAADAVSRGASRLYDLRFTARLRAEVAARQKDGLLDPGLRLPARMRVREFDELYTAPQAGFRDADEYYARCSSGPHLARIETPTVVLGAADDPLVAARTLRTARRSAAVSLHVEPHGGHLGYLAARPTPLGTRRWLDHALDVFAEDLLTRR